MVWGDEYMIKLFASDLDGTLLNELHESDEVIFNSIQQVLNKNLYFTIATGRDLNGSLRNTGFETLPIYKICMNGAFIAAPNKEILYKKEIDKAFLKEILTQFPNIHFDCISIDHTYVQGTKKEYIQHFYSSNIWKNLHFSKEILEGFISSHKFECSLEEILSKDILKLNCRVHDEEARIRLDNFLENHKDCVTNAPFEKGAYEITDISVNKGNAVKTLADYLNINTKEVAVYGDGGNDLEMLQMFEHSYATENACEEAKQYAKEIIGHCKDHAVPLHIIKTLSNC